LTNVGGTLFFAANDGVDGQELWRTTPGASGAQRVRDINVGPGYSNPSYLTNLNGTLLFDANDGKHGVELWRSDGTRAGTNVVKDIASGSGNNRPSLPSFPRDFVGLGATILFAASDDYFGPELWRSDGTASGTHQVWNVASASRYSYPEELTNVNGVVFFHGGGGGRGAELWRTNGTAAGTVIVKDINPGADVGSYPEGLTNIGGTLFFAANNGVSGEELWRSDGTPGGTVIVRDINPGPGSSYPSFLTNVGGTVFFTVRGAYNEESLWCSDGTGAGTRLLLAARTHPPRDLVNVNGTLFFTSEDAYGIELWRSDGTPEGTRSVEAPGMGLLPNPGSLTNVNGTLFFAGGDGVDGAELFRSNGNAGGTVLVKELEPGSFGSRPAYLTNVNGTLFFQANNSHGVTQVWRSNGTPAGTVQLTNFQFIAKFSSLWLMTNVCGTLFFNADDGHGYEIWQSDGTRAGTHMVADITPDGVDSQPRPLVNVQGSLVFEADDGIHGAEPWILPVSTATTMGLASSALPSVYGQAVTLTAIVHTAPGSGPATGAITFRDGTTLLGTGMLNATGRATLSTAQLGAGNHAITALYGGDSTFAGSVSVFGQTVYKDATSAVVQASVNPSVFGQTVTFTAKVHASLPGGGLPTGTVTFMDGSTKLGTGTVNGGQATVSTAILSVGNHIITAFYSGDKNFAGATSQVYGQTVRIADRAGAANLAVASGTSSPLPSLSVAPARAQPATSLTSVEVDHYFASKPPARRTGVAMRQLKKAVVAVDDWLK
jgi:ELWxxDGT repeat protein